MQRLEEDDPDYPPVLNQRLGDVAPKCLILRGNAAILRTHKTGLFCSARCPGDRILQTYEHVQALRDRGVTVISGFHSPIEKECLRILLRGQQPIIICPARTLEGMKLPTDWQHALDARRLLLLPPFPATQRRASVSTANRRNELVAALADEVLFIYAKPGGRTVPLAEYMKRWNVSVSSL